MNGPLPKLKNAYSVVRAWVDRWKAAPHVSKYELGVGRHYDFNRIARLGDAWGERLDALGASYEQLRWLAGADDPSCVVERDRRYRALVVMLEGEDGRRDFKALRESFPKLGRAAARERRAAVAGGSPPGQRPTTGGQRRTG